MCEIHVTNINYVFYHNQPFQNSQPLYIDFDGVLYIYHLNCTQKYM